MRDLLIATHNQGKLIELQQHLDGLPFKVVDISATSIPSTFRVDEVGETFEGNALIKAMVCGKKSGKLTIADDSGLCVDALNGAPGVRSARYVEGNDIDRYKAVLKEMKDVPDEKRTAKFISVLALYDPDKDIVRITTGECLGYIGHEPKGERGFGYDPIFYVDEIKKTYAEATLEEKMAIDHRGKAIEKMRQIFIKEFV